MRLVEYEKNSIKKVFHEVFGDGKIYLFGSRVDDTQRGGDIDLYLSPKEKFDNIHERKINFLLKLNLLIGEQKIDVLIEKDKNRLIEQVALRDGIIL